jgi:hypothetical protein
MSGAGGRVAMFVALALASLPSAPLARALPAPSPDRTIAELIGNPGFHYGKPVRITGRVTAVFANGLAQLSDRTGVTDHVLVLMPGPPTARSFAPGATVRLRGTLRPLSPAVLRLRYGWTPPDDASLAAPIPVLVVG